MVLSTAHVEQRILEVDEVQGTKKLLPNLDAKWNYFPKSPFWAGKIAQWVKALAV